MRQFTLKLDRVYKRPLIYFGDNNMKALLDTGAFYPIWTQPTYILEKLNAVSCGKKIKFSLTTKITLLTSIFRQMKVISET